MNRMKINVLLPFLLFAWHSVIAQNVESPLHDINKTSAYTYKILPLGNSITFDNRENDTRNIGEKAGYRHQLYNLLNSGGYKFDFIGSEHSGGQYLPAGFDDNAGFPGITDDQLLNLLISGRLLQEAQGIDRQITAGPYLDTYSPDIILLHIGTNGNESSGGTSPNEVEQILDEIDDHEIRTGNEVIVLLARIIDRVPNESFVNAFNNNVEAMALDRISNPSNDAYPDNIVIVDMEDSAGLNYLISPDPNGSPGDMNDSAHPNNNGYAKMAVQWYSAIQTILPNPPVILEHPNNQYAIEGGNASFSVLAESEEPFSFQWRKNGSNIPFANNSTLNLNNIKYSDNLATINCLISNINGAVVSNSAKLYVNKNDERISNGIIAEYDFEEGGGDLIENKVASENNLDLKIFESESINWIQNGISIINSTNISTDQPAYSIVDSINMSNQFSFEIWFSTPRLTQTGPARIITISANNNERNFTLGQNADTFVFRTRTTETNLNGIPEFYSQNGIVQDELMHVVVSRGTEGDEKIFINGVLNNTENVSGDLSNWDNNYKMAIGNEFQTNQPWLGNIYHLAIYRRALQDDEVLLNYNLGESGLTSVNNNRASVVDGFELFQNYPNPFNPSTKIKFSIPYGFHKYSQSINSKVLLKVFDLLGNELVTLVNSSLKPGIHTVNFDASKYPSGIYFYRLVYGEYSKTHKMTLLK